MRRAAEEARPKTGDDATERYSVRKAENRRGYCRAGNRRAFTKMPAKGEERRRPFRRERCRAHMNAMAGSDRHGLTFVRDRFS